MSSTPINVLIFASSLQDKLSLITLTIQSHKFAYTYLATESLTTFACVGFREVRIFSVRVVSCLLKIHLRKSLRLMPKRRVDVTSDASVSGSTASPCPEIWILPR